MTGRYAPKRSKEGLIGDTQELSSASRLWRSVLGQGVRDLYEGDGGLRSEVFTWMLTSDFDDVCDLANCHPNDMRQQLTALAALPLPLAKKFGKMLRAKIMEDVFVS